MLCKRVMHNDCIVTLHEHHFKVNFERSGHKSDYAIIRCDC